MQDTTIRQSTTRRRLVVLAALTLILALGAALRFYQIGAESYWIDEIYTVTFAEGNLDSLLHEAQRQDVPIDYFLPLYGWVRLFGTTEAATRSLSALFGVLALLPIYLAGRELFDDSAGLIAALLAAISEYQIYYSQETRFYSLFGLAAGLSLFLFARLLRRQDNLSLVLYAFSTWFMFWSMAFGILTIAAQNLYVLLRWRRYKALHVRWLVCQTAIAIAIVATILPALTDNSIISKDQAGVQWISRPAWSAPLRTLYTFVLPMRYQRPWTAVVISFAAGVGVLLAGTAAYIIRRGRRGWLSDLKGLLAGAGSLWGKGDELLLLGLWLLVPIVTLFAWSRIGPPLYHERYVIGAAPALYLLLAYAIVRARRFVPVPAVLIALAMIVAPGLQEYYHADQKEQWREAAAYVEQRRQDSDAVILAPDQDGWQQACFLWYARDARPVCGIPIEPADDASLNAALRACLGDRQRFWLIMRGPNSSVDYFRRALVDSDQIGKRLLDRRDFVGVSVYLFERTE